jgi:hypothetical protein
MTTASVLALGTPSFTSSVLGGLPFAFLAKGGSWASSSAYVVIATGAPAHSSRRAVEGSWQNFHHDVSPQLPARSERFIP